MKKFLIFFVIFGLVLGAFFLGIRKMDDNAKAASELETTTGPTATDAFMYEYIKDINKNSLKDINTCLKYEVVEEKVIITGIGEEWQGGSLLIPEKIGGLPVVKIKMMAFAENEKLTEIKISEGITEIDEGAFLHCENLKKVKLPDGLSSISYNTFKYCSSLEYIEIPDSVKYIAKDAFAECNNLKTIGYSGSQEKWLILEVDEGNEILETPEILFKG